MNGTPLPDVEFHWGMAAWKYDHLRGALYGGLPRSEWLSAYARVYDHVELDVLRYMWPSDASLEAWKEQTPDAFRFIPKMHQHLTHGTGQDFGSAADWWDALAPLHDRVPGALLQFPPSMERKPSAESRVQDRVASIQCTAFVELRHPSWEDWVPDGDVVSVWRIDDGLPRSWSAHPDLGVVRFRGSDLAIQGELQRDRRPAFDAVAQHIRQQPWRTCHIIMTNHFEGSAPLSIDRLAAALESPAPDRSRAGRAAGQTSLF